MNRDDIRRHITQELIPKDRNFINVHPSCRYSMTALVQNVNELINLDFRAADNFREWGRPDLVKACIFLFLLNSGIGCSVEG